MKCPAFKPGRTLVEVLISLLVMAIVLTISFPLVYRAASKLPVEASLTSATERVFFLFQDVRRMSVVLETPIRIRYLRQNTGFLFEAFPDANLDRLPDPGTRASDIRRVEIRKSEDRNFENLRILFGGVEPVSVDDMVAYDGAFLRVHGVGNASTEYSNYTIDFQINNLRKSIRLRNSLPKLVE